MRRIAPALAGLLALLVFAPGASASSTACRDFDYHGYHARGVRAVNLGCHDADLMVRGYIDNGHVGGYYCTRSALPHDVTEVLCSRQHHGVKSGAHFGIQPMARAHAASAASCSNLVYHGYDAVSIRESGVGCTYAHGLARHAIDHGASGLHHWSCGYTTFTRPQHGERWTCRGTDTFVTFVLYLRAGARGPTH